MQHFGVCKKRAFGIFLPQLSMLNNKYPQAVRIMKLTAFILRVCLLQVSANSRAQEKITIKEKGASLVKIFTQINKQTGYNFFFTNEDLRNAKPVDIEVKNASLKEVLDILFKKQDLTYIISENIITIVSKKNNAPHKEESALPPPIDIYGKVVDENGKPIAGVTVTVKGTKKQTITSDNGEFTIPDVPENSVLLFSSVNMEAFEMNVSGRSKIFAQLKTKTAELDEVQIIAYGQTTKRFQTGNVSTVKAIDIERQPVNNSLLALEGRVPGLFITQATGVPGSAVTVRVQGENSISKGNEPLYVIDGVPFVSQLISTQPDYLGSILGSARGSLSNGNPLSYLNPADIESIDVLKGADATSIYGSRAANGAILITTKKGRAGKTSVNINLQKGWGKITRKLDLLNTDEYLEMRKEALVNDGAVAQNWESDINGDWDSTSYTDWQKELIGGTAQYFDVQANASGGNSNTQFLFGSGYHRETTVYPGSFSDQKGSFHFNLNNVSNNQKFRIQVSSSFVTDNNHLPGNDLTSTAIGLAPNAPNLYNDDGSINWAINSSGFTTWENGIHPLNYTLVPYNTKAKNLLANSVLSYQFIRGLELKGSFGYNFLQTDETRFSPLNSYAPENRPYFSRIAIYANNTISSWIIEPQISYTKSFGNSTVEALAGGTLLENSLDGEVLRGRGYNSDNVLKDIKAASSVTVDATTAAIYKYNAIFGRINYRFLEKYIINLSVRRDGSSRFGSENRFHNFESVGAAWIFSKEKLISESIKILSFGKLRGSYGTSGNDQIGDYQYLSLFSPLSVGVPYQGITALIPKGLTNPYLQWEETKKMELGLDLGFLNDRILLNTVYYRNRSSNQLLGYSLPIITGFQNVIKNFPAKVENSGWEFFLTSTNIKGRNFFWSSSLNLTIPKNKLIEFPNLSTSTYAAFLVIGQPITITKAFQFAGVDPATGTYQFLDSNGNASSKPTAGADQTQLINTSPKFYGGIQNTFEYRGVQISFLFQFVKQIGRNYLLGRVIPGSFNSNQPAWLTDRWQKSGEEKQFQRYNSDYSIYQQFANAINSDYGFSDASFIRLKNISISYSLPEAMRRSAHLQNCKLFIHAQNLATITKYKGLDPENLITGSSLTLPPLRLITLGIQLTL